MIETRATWGDGWIKGLAAKFADVENQADMAYSLGIDSALGVENNSYTRLFKDKTSDKAEEKTTSKSGVGYPSLTTEGQDYATDSRQPGYRTVWKFIKKTNSIEITEEEKEDRDNDLSDKFDEAKDLRIGFMMEFDRSAFSIFNYAFTAQASLPADLTFYSDAVPLCSIQHPLKVTSSTHSNASATGIPLTETNLETGRQALRRQLDDRGLPMSIGSGRIILLVPDSLEKTAVTITKSTLRSSTANNDLNIYRDGIVTVISTKWLNSQQTSGSDTAWFLIDSMKSPFVFYKRRGIQTTVYVDNKNKNTVYDISARWQVGNKEWRGVWGSLGANATYAL
jgi:hypothetical protein